jgi:hypothetical protein
MAQAVEHLLCKALSSNPFPPKRNKYFFAVLGLELKAFTLSHSTSPIFCDRGFFEIESHELFAWAGFNPHPPDLCLLSS